MNTQMVVGGLMTGAVTTCKEETGLKDLVQILTESRLSCVIVENDDKPVGIVTESDVVALFRDHLVDGMQIDDFRVGEFMSPSPVCVEEMTPLFEALVLTQTHKVRHLPVLDAGGHLVGMLTFRELAKAYEQIVAGQKKVMEEEVGNKTRYLKELNEQLVALSLEDALLGIGNRRAMEVDIDYTHKAALERSGDYALLLFDVDYFKRYNDFYGHQAGDEALRSIVKSIQEGIRSSDRLYRYGGEELLLLMVGTSLKRAEETAQRCVKILYQLGLQHEKSPEGVLTMSGGVSSFRSSPAATWEDVLANADVALYRAKAAGRNQIDVFQPVSGDTHKK